MTLARWLRTTPWELLDVPADWLAACSTVMQAEAEAEAEAQRRRERRARMQRMISRA